MDVRNLTYLCDGERIFIHAIPAGRIYYKIVLPELTPFIEHGFRSFLNTTIGKIRFYFKDSISGEEIDDDRSKAPQYVEKKGMG